MIWTDIKYLIALVVTVAALWFASINGITNIPLPIYR